MVKLVFIFRIVFTDHCFDALREVYEVEPPYSIFSTRDVSAAHILCCIAWSSLAFKLTVVVSSSLTYAKIQLNRFPYPCRPADSSIAEKCSSIMLSFEGIFDFGRDTRQRVSAKDLEYLVVTPFYCEGDSSTAGLFSNFFSGHKSLLVESSEI